MSHPSKSSTTLPSSYVTRSGRISKSPSLFMHNDTSLTNKSASSVKAVPKLTNANVSNRLETAEDDINVSDEPGEELETDENKESSNTLHSSSSHGSTTYGDSSDDSSESSCGYCWGCDQPGSKGTFCTADGCEDSQNIYQ